MSANRVAVIGGGLGGLAAAGALAKAGCEVHLFEATDQVGGKARGVQGAGVTLDAGPTLLTMPEVVRRTFDSLGAGDLMPKLFELDHQCAYHFEDGCRFDVYADLERTAKSAADLRPSEARGLYSFYSAAHALYEAAGAPYLEAPFETVPRFLARAVKSRAASALWSGGMGTLHDLGRRHFRTDHLQQFVGRFATYAGASPFDASAVFALIPWLEHAQGVHHVQGGIGALARALGNAVERAGVQVHLDSPARWNQRGAEWLVTTQRLETTFDAVVVNADPMQALGRGDEALSLSGYVLLLSVPGELELPHHSVLFSADYRHEFDQLFSGLNPEDPTLYLCHATATDRSMAEPGRSGLFVMVNAPTLGVCDAEHWGRRAEILRARILDRLDALVPGIANSATVVGQRTPVDFAALGAPKGSIYGFLPRGLWGPFRRPKLRGNAPGLFFAGGGTHPGGGVPLVLLSGRYAAQLTLEHLEGGGR